MKKFVIFLVALFFLMPLSLTAEGDEGSRFRKVHYDTGSFVFEMVEDKEFSVVCYIAHAPNGIMSGSRNISMQCFPKVMLTTSGEQLQEMLKQLEQLTSPQVIPDHHSTPKDH